MYAKPEKDNIRVRISEAKKSAQANSGFHGLVRNCEVHAFASCT